MKKKNSKNESSQTFGAKSMSMSNETLNKEISNNSINAQPASNNKEKVFNQTFGSAERQDPEVTFTQEHIPKSLTKRSKKKRKTSRSKLVSSFIHSAGSISQQTN